MQARGFGEGAWGRDCGCQVIDVAVNPGNMHLFIKCPLKYSVSYISKKSGNYIHKYYISYSPISL